MKNIIKYFVISSLFLLTNTFVGCVKDRGNYDYVDIPELAMSDFKGQLNGSNVQLSDVNVLLLEQDDILKIANSEVDVFANAEYSWEIGDRSPQQDINDKFPIPVQIATTRDLNYKVTYGPGQYTLYYTVTNKDNNSKFSAKFQVDVSSILGMLVLSVDEAGKGDYAAVRNAELTPTLPESKYGVSRDLYAASAAGAKLDKPTNIFFIAGRREPSTVFVAIEGNILSLDYNTLRVFNSDYSSLFAFKPKGEFNAQAFIMGANSTEYLINNGQVYCIWYSGSATQFGGSLGKIGKTYSPFICVVSRTHVVYNATDRRFEHMDQFGTPAEFGSDGGVVDILNPRMDLVYLDKGNGDVCDAVMKDDAGKLFYVRFNLASFDKVSCQYSLPLSDLPGMSKDSKWAIAERGNVAFYTSGNELYVLNSSTGVSTPAKLDFPSTAKIDVVKVLKDGTNLVNTNALVLLGVNDGGSGKLYQYNFNPLSGVLDMSSEKVVDGFDRIIGMNLKNL